MACGGLNGAMLQVQGREWGLAWEGRKESLFPDSIRLSPGYPRAWGWVLPSLGGPVLWDLEWAMG